ncbi:MAG: hypothetical protein V1853_04510 [bacterium]
MLTKSLVLLLIAAAIFFVAGCADSHDMEEMVIASYEEGLEHVAQKSTTAYSLMIRYRECAVLTIQNDAGKFVPVMHPANEHYLPVQVFLPGDEDAYSYNPEAIQLFISEGDLKERGLALACQIAKAYNYNPLVDRPDSALAYLTIREEYNRSEGQEMLQIFYENLPSDNALDW